MTLGELIRIVEERGSASPAEALALCKAVRQYSEIATETCMMLGDACLGRLPSQEQTGRMLDKSKAVVVVDLGESALDRRNDGN